MQLAANRIALLFLLAFSFTSGCVSPIGQVVDIRIETGENDLLRFEKRYPKTDIPAITMALQEAVDQGYKDFRKQLDKDLFHYLQENISFEYLSTFQPYYAPQLNVVSYRLDFLSIDERGAWEQLRMETLLFRLDSGRPVSRDAVFADTQRAYSLIAAFCYENMKDKVPDRAKLQETLGSGGEGIKNFVAKNEGLLVLYHPGDDLYAEIGVLELLIPWERLPITRF